MNGSTRLDWLRPSVIEGAWLIQTFISTGGARDTESASRLLRSTYSSATADLYEAERLITLLEPVQDKATLYRSVFWIVIESVRPAWLTLLLRGRVPTLEALDPDAAECFRRCGALAASPDPAVVDWLDSLARLARGDDESKRMEAGRAAERLSLERENQLLVKESGTLAAEWVALNDNAAGYDIKSYRRFDGRLSPIFIEVKACSSASLEFYVTRNEWETAKRSGERYFFHVWLMARQELLELSASQVARHIPQDGQNGRWLNARVTWAPGGEHSEGPCPADVADL
jgi:hypothetical protein